MPHTALHPEIEKLIEVFQESTPDKLYDADAPRVQVSHIMSKLSFIYEKIRNAVDYSEEHLIRKNAIHRILKRRIRLSLHRKNIGRALIHELIRAKYLENNTVPEGKIPVIEAVVAKYMFLLESIAQTKGLQSKLRYFDWILGIASCEVEEKLDLLIRDTAMVNTMYAIVKEKIKFSEDKEEPAERDLQLSIAIQRCLIKSDPSIIAYHLINVYYPKFRAADIPLLQSMAKEIDMLYERIQYELKHEMSFKLARKLKTLTVYLTVLRDVLEKDISTAQTRFLNPAVFETDVRAAATKRYQSTSAKLTRSIINTVVYIFVTKIILAFLLELPYELFVIREFHPLPLTMNVVFPPLFMYFLAKSASLPTTQNTLAIIAGLKDFVSSAGNEKEEYVIKAGIKRSATKTVIFTFIYFVIYCITFGGIIVGLRAINFNGVSIFLFLLFLCVVSFLGIKIRDSVKNLNVLKIKDGFLSSLVDFLFLPILTVGRWISMKFSKINVFAFALDFIIEAPFKTVLEIVEEWFSFMKEKEEEIY